MAIEQTTVSANGLTFGALHCGEGPLALCLHGFPDSAHTWRHLLPALADAGFHAVAPWTRGYSPSAVAPDGNYSITSLAADANALHDVFGGGEDAVLIGHDWGAITAYLAASAAGLWRRVVTLAVPPPSTAANAFLNYRQLKRSFSITLFQTPLAELVVGADDLSFIENLWADWSPSYDAAEDLPHVKAALGAPANLAAAIGYYRAMFGGALPMSVPSVPTLYLHGTADGAFGVEGTADAEAELGSSARVERLEGLGHFLHLEDPSRVNSLILDWVTTRS